MDQILARKIVNYKQLKIKDYKSCEKVWNVKTIRLMNA